MTYIIRIIPTPYNKMEVRKFPVPLERFFRFNFAMPPPTPRPPRDVLCFGNFLLSLYAIVCVVSNFFSFSCSFTSVLWWQSPSLPSYQWTLSPFLSFESLYSSSSSRTSCFCTLWQDTRSNSTNQSKNKKKGTSCTRLCSLVVFFFSLLTAFQVWSQWKSVPNARWWRWSRRCLGSGCLFQVVGFEINDSWSFWKIFGGAIVRLMYENIVRSLNHFPFKVLSVF